MDKTKITVAEASSRMSQEKLDMSDYLREHMTESERWLWEILKHDRAGAGWLASVPFLGYILDFYCEDWRLCVELDGAFHNDRHESDKFRDQILKEHGVKTIRIPSRLIFKSPQAVLRMIRFVAGVDMFPSFEYPSERRNKKHRRISPRKFVFGINGS